MSNPPINAQEKIPVRGKPPGHAPAPRATHTHNPVWRSLALRPGVLQRKLTVGAPGDAYEQEADRAAESVTNAPTPLVQRACACGGECPKCSGEDEGGRVQTRAFDGAGAALSEAPPVVEEALRSPGSPLDAPTRGLMEERLGHDFGGVRVHTGAKAAESAQAVNALAYTVGPDIVLGAGAPPAETEAGRELLAHELTHVVQQSGGSDSQALQRWSLSNCNLPQSVYVEDAFAKSFDDLSKAVSILKPPTTAFVKNALWLAFRDDSEATADRLRKSIGILQKNITSTHITCLDSKHPDCAEDVGFHRAGEISLCMPTFSDLGPVEQAHTLTHEAAHKYLDVRDTGYFSKSCEETPSRPGPENKDSGTAGDNPAQRFNNADAYTCFVHFLVRQTVAGVAGSAAAYRGEALELEAKERTVYTVTETPSRDEGAFRIKGAPANSGFKYRWTLTDAGGEEFPLAALNKAQSDPGVFNDDVLAVYVPKATRLRLGEKKVAKATIRCEVRLFKPEKGSEGPAPIVKSVEVNIAHGQDPFDLSIL
jgi:hypothetical protein